MSRLKPVSTIAMAVERCTFTPERSRIYPKRKKTARGLSQTVARGSWLYQIGAQRNV
jgi:hypothetical protein